MILSNFFGTKFEQTKKKKKEKKKRKKMLEITICKNVDVK